VKLDGWRLFGSLVGQSEATTRRVIQQVEAFGACVLMIDELDKSFAGMKGDAVETAVQLAGYRNFPIMDAR